MKTTIRLSSIVLAFLSVNVLPTARAFCQQGCLTNRNTVLGDDGLINNNTTGFQKTATGYNALVSNTITLTAARRRVNGINTVRLTWSGATSSFVEIQRCFPGPTCETIITTVNDGAFIISLGSGRVRVMYRVCEKGGTGACSNIVTVVFPPQESEARQECRDISRPRH
jgi:hypothetical protein